MESWTSLREEHPQIFKDIVVMQQPSATADEIIVGWGLEDLGQRFPAAVLQRDLVSGALSDRARMAAFLQNIICCWVAPQMTPVVQVTVTDFAFPIKRKIDQQKMKIVQEFKNAALKEGREVSFKMGPWELVKVLWRAISEFNKQADQQQLTVKALRRNGQLAYTCKGGEFVKITQENSPWVSKIGEIGSHRYPASWLEDRFASFDRSSRSSRLDHHRPRSLQECKAGRWRYSVRPRSREAVPGLPAQ